MDHRITADERATFKRCRRQWDFGSPNRRNLEPEAGEAPTLTSAIRDALAIYYYPGTWDWSRDIVLPLVRKAFLRSIAGDSRLAEAGIPILDTYTAWAPALDDFAPVKIDHEVDALVPDPEEPGHGLLTEDGRRIVFTARIDLLAVDAADTYWVVRHRIVDEWQDLSQLLLDEEAVAGCWAWEQAYPGMEIAGTIHNELRTVGAATPAPRRRFRLRRVAQHEPSGGGRSVPQHRRRIAQSTSDNPAVRVERRDGGPVRRTRIRRGRAEIAEAGRLIAREARELSAAGIDCYPAPGGHCRDCRFSAPCVAMTEGGDPDLSRYRVRRERSKPRPGQSTWGLGRGAAPPEFE